MEWTRQTYNSQYEKWVPWMEDKYLAWFGQNKTSYVAKDWPPPAAAITTAVTVATVTLNLTATTFQRPLQRVPKATELKTNPISTGELDKTKITNNDQINKIQDTVNEGLTGQLGKGGLGEEAGKLTSDQVFTRSERQGKGSGGGLL